MAFHKNKKGDRYGESRNLPITGVYQVVGSRALVDAAVQQRKLVPVFRSPRLALFSRRQVDEFQLGLERGEVVVTPIDWKSRSANH